jgi:hypothetical protein
MQALFFRPPEVDHMRKAALFATVVLCLCCASAGRAAPRFIRGDSNQNGAVSLSDAVYVLHYIFSGKEAGCEDALDVDDDGRVSIADSIGLLHFLFRGGEAPRGPYPECGVDETGDAIGCEFFNPDICPPPEAPPCLSAEEFSNSFTLSIDRSVCLPSPLFETELLGTAIVVCPEGSVCSNDSAGCDLHIQDITAEADLVAGALLTTITMSTAPPIDVGRTQCSTEITIESTLSMDMVMEPTGWDGIAEITQLNNFQFAVTDFDLNAEGGLACGLLELSGAVLREILQSELNALVPDLVRDFTLELGEVYVCTDAAWEQ